MWAILLMPVGTQRRYTSEVGVSVADAFICANAILADLG